ncbi:MAG: hypothetical protein ABI811_19085 [Acidobacteriota bacterium]
MIQMEEQLWAKLLEGLHDEEMGLRSKVQAYETARNREEASDWKAEEVAAADARGLQVWMKVYVTAALNRLAELCWPPKSPEVFEEQMKGAVVSLLDHLPAYLSDERGREMLDWAWIQKAANREASSLIAQMKSKGDLSTPPVAQYYPTWKYHWNLPGKIVNSPEEEVLLPGGWGDSADFSPYQAPRLPRGDHNALLKWVDKWNIPGLRPDHRILIQSALSKAHVAFLRTDGSDSSGVASMVMAFDGIAKVLFDGNLLTEPVLESDIASLVWDSAIAGGWWRYASETPKSIFPTRLGHYWVWLDEKQISPELFLPERILWRSRLLEVSVAPISAPTPAPAINTGNDLAQITRSRDGGFDHTTWEHVEITLISDERIRTKVKEEADTLNFAEMGFEDRRNGKPAQNWAVLLVLARTRGKISDSTANSKEWLALAKRIERTRKALCKHFRINGDPIPYTKGVGYVSRFKISRAPAADS